jgi:membrane protein YdbS with pleckstrin-like domain
MFERIRALVLRVLRVPAAPEPPIGAPESVRIFRAARNHYRVRIARWSFTQIAALIGIAFSVYLLHLVTPPPEVPLERAPAASEPRGEGSEQPAPVDADTPPSDAAVSTKEKTGGEPERSHRAVARQLRHAAPHWLQSPLRWVEEGAAPSRAILVLTLLKVGGILFYLVQLPLTFAAARLDYEMHWYVVTDRSLRIRSGVWKVQESTMSFANLQQVEVRQGPLQRLLGIADVRVQSAGGGGGGSPGAELHGNSAGDSLHVGVFRGVDNAPQIRDLIVERLRAFRAAGLGDPEDRAAEPSPHKTESPALAAGRELLAEARALREALQRAT